VDHIVPKPVWQNEDVYIIGGGTSLKYFPWQILKDHKTIGCNDAYKLGMSICKVCVFGDAKWYSTHKHDLIKFNGDVYCAEPELDKTSIPWVNKLKRYATGLQTDGVGWNFNTGAVAINLAILFGAKRIFLLGFDMFRGKDSNWHPNELDKNPDEVYLKFIEGFNFLCSDWKKKFPDVEIINVTDDSALECFPKVGLEEHFDGEYSDVLPNRNQVA